MKRASLSIVLSIVSLTFGLSLTAIAQTGPSRPEKWEYKVIGCTSETELNKYGDAGWELVVAFYYSTGCSNYLKRPKREFFDPNAAPPPPAGPSRCNLTPAQAPVFRGIRLGMSMEELLALFPRSKEQSKTIEALSKAEANYGEVHLEFGRDLYPENREMFSNNVVSYTTTLFDGRVTSFNAYYSFPAPNNRSHAWTPATWLNKLSESYKIPEQKDWEFLGNYASIGCQDFQMRVYASDNSTSIRMIGPPYDDQKKQRREAAAAKLRGEAKP
jgi:hypothetical protein